MDPTKIHPTLLEAINLATRSAVEEAFAVEETEFPIIVRYRPQALSFKSLREGSEGMRVERQLELLPAAAGTATRTEIEALSESATVEMIWFDEPVYAMLDTSVPLLNVPSIWAMGYQGEGMRICIVDTGIDTNHPDLADRIVGQQDFTGEGLGDRHGHGTHVASTAAGSGAASDGKYRGVAPKAQILSAKVLRANATGRMSFVMAGVEWAVEQGADVINLSLGSRGPCDGTDATSAICNAAVDAGAVVVVAAGNDGPAAQTIGSPGCAEKVITIGAVTDADTVADFSSRGPTLDGRVKPDLVVPGVSIVAAMAGGTNYALVVNEWYTRDQGTSMATPHAAGVAALMLQANPKLTPADVKRIMMESALPLAVDKYMQGTGRLQAARALDMARSGVIPPSPEPSPPSPPSPSPEPRPEVPPAPERDGCVGSLMRVFGRR